MKTSRRGFLAKIFASAVAAPAVTKLITGGIPSNQPIRGMSGFVGAFNLVSTVYWLALGDFNLMGLSLAGAWAGWAAHLSFRRNAT